MEMIAFLVFSAMVGAVIVRISGHSSKVRLESIRMQIETNAEVLEHRLALRRMEDDRERRLLGDGK